MTNERKKVVLTGDRPTGPLHLGHYVGSLASRIALQETCEQYVMIADTQALTDYAKEPDRIRNPKVVVEQLTGNDMERERLCWEDTSLEILRERGVDTGLQDYICEVEQYLRSIIEQ